MKPNNMVADYQVKTETCWNCRGTGKLQFNNKKELVEYLRGDYNFSEARDLCRLYDKYGEIDCDKCGGDGIIEEWI